MTTDTNFDIFKANDIRGKYPGEINEKIVSEIVRRFSQHIISKAKKPVGGQKPEARLVVACDARSSSPILYKAVVNQLKVKNSRIEIIEVGLSTTPMFYFWVKKSKAAGGIMITASHNPKDYNGLKIVDENAMSISGLEIKKLFRR